MKIDPYFQRVLDVLIGSFGSAPAFHDWHNRGCPVVEEEVERSPFKTGLQTDLVTGLMDQLAAANARIKELDARLALAEESARVIRLNPTNSRGL